MHITTVSPTKPQQRTTFATRKRVGLGFDRAEHARQSWDYYMAGVRAAGTANPARRARNLAAAAAWRAILAKALLDATR